MFANMDNVSSVCLLNSLRFHSPSSNEIIERFVQNSDVVSMVLIQCFFVISFVYNQVIFSVGYKSIEERENSSLRFFILE